MCINKSLVFCASYLCIPSACQVIERYGADKTAVVSADKKIIHFFSLIYPDVILIQLISSFSGFFKFVTVRNIYKRDFILIKGYDVYFFIVARGVLELSLIRLLSRNNYIYYKPAVMYKFGFIDKSLKAKILTLYYELFFCVDYYICDLSGEKTCVLSDDFLHRICAIKFDFNDDDLAKAKSRIKDILRLDGKKWKILYMAGGVVSSGLVNENEYIEKGNHLLLWLIKKYGESSIVIKGHPRLNDLYSLECSFERIPDFIPLNMIFNNFDIVIGYFSATLFEAANQGVVVYSTLEYYTPKNTNVRDQYINYLKSNLNKNAKIGYLDEYFKVNYWLGR